MKALGMAAALAALATGCTSARTAGLVLPIPAAGGTTYHVIVGFGVVRVNDGTPSAAVVTDAHSLGAVVTDRPGMKIGLGYAASSVVSVPPDARDVRIEVSRKPWGALHVDAQAAQLDGPDDKGNGPE